MNLETSGTVATFGVLCYNDEANQIVTKLSHRWIAWDLESFKIFFGNSTVTYTTRKDYITTF